jgi:hypothetical protein
MVKGTIIEEKNCFSDDSARRFMQTIQQMSCNISNPDLSLHSSPSRPYPLCLSGFREVKSFLYLFTHSSPLFTHIEIHYTQYGKEKKRKKPPVPYASGAFFMHQAAKVLPGGGTIEIPFVYISLTAFIRALYQRNR